MFYQVAKLTNLELTVGKHATASRQTHVIVTLAYAAVEPVLQDGLELIVNVSIFSNVFFISKCPDSHLFKQCYIYSI